VVRVAALESLAGLGGEGTREIALRAVEDSSGDVRATAVRMLAAYGDPGDAGILRDLLRDPSARVRGEVVRALGALGALEAAVRAGVRDGSPTVRRVALESARLLPAEAARDLVEGAPKEKDPFLAGLRAALIRGGTN
jgi:HEAT repeat protein